MGQILFIVWRESVEALLVVGILYAWLKNGDDDARRGLPFLWAGVAAGLLMAVGLGAALVGFTEVLSGDAQDYFQTAMVLIACVLIVQMVLWMRRHGARSSATWSNRCSAVRATRTGGASRCWSRSRSRAKAARR
jgi:high-affinity iron transporter